MRTKLCLATLRVAATVGLVAALAAVVLMVVCAVGVYVWFIRLGIEYFGGNTEEVILYSVFIPIAGLGSVWIGRLTWICSEPLYEALVDRFCKEKQSAQ